MLIPELTSTSKLYRKINTEDLAAFKNNKKKPKLGGSLEQKRMFNKWLKTMQSKSYLSTLRRQNIAQAIKNSIPHCN